MALLWSILPVLAWQFAMLMRILILAGHDIRRTLSTMCGEMNVPIAHAEAVLNHVSGTLAGVAGIYWLYKYAREKRRALGKWEARFTALPRDISAAASCG